MRAFAERLNENLLLPSLQDARELLAVRERLIDRGEAFEEDGETEVFSAWEMFAPGNDG